MVHFFEMKLFFTTFSIFFSLLFLIFLLLGFQSATFPWTCEKCSLKPQQILSLQHLFHRSQKKPFLFQHPCSSSTRGCFSIYSIVVVYLLLPGAISHILSHTKTFFLPVLFSFLMFMELSFFLNIFVFIEV